VGGWAREGDLGRLARELRGIWLPGMGMGRRATRSWGGFWTWLARRLLLVIAQLLLGSTVLFLFTVFLQPGQAGGIPGAQFLPAWSTFLAQLFTGQWGQVLLATGAQVPVTTIMGYYLPYSIELAAFSLLFTALVAYPLGLLSGWRRGGGLDNTTRLLAAFGAFFPLVALALYVTDFLYGPFVHTFGTPLFGSLPSGVWFAQHYGGYPSWVGYFGQTSPTGFPLLDAALHEAWNVEALIWLNLLIQSLVIGLIYAALYLRYARLATLGTRDPVTTAAARARGIPERDLLWRHTSRQVLPIYVYTFGNTFALFLLIQSLGEWFFQDTGMGQFLIYEVVVSIQYLPPPQGPPLLAVLAFLILVAVLTVNLIADAVSRWLDPRLGWGGRRT
jgi:peptide/nickel transport system permease protein